MKKITKTKFAALFVAVTMVFTSCGTAQKNGTLIGGGGGAALGALIGSLVSGHGDKTKGALIGGAIGGAVGGTAGNLIGKHMDKVKAQAQAAAANATVETVKIDGLDAVKVTFDNGILFSVGKANLQSAAQSELSKFSTVLKNNTDCNVAILGFASSDGSDATNLTLSKNRANAVSTYLKSQGVGASQLAKVDGLGEDPNYLVRNADGSENMEASRRVEVYLFASEAMIQAAQNGTLK